MVQDSKGFMVKSLHTHTHIYIYRQRNIQYTYTGTHAYLWPNSLHQPFLKGNSGCFRSLTSVSCAAVGKLVPCEVRSGVNMKNSSYINTSVRLLIIGSVGNLNQAPHPLPQDYWHSSHDLFVHSSPHSRKEWRAVGLFWLETTGGSRSGNAEN